MVLPPEQAILLFMKASISILCVLLLTMTTPLPALLIALSRIGVPTIFTNMLSFFNTFTERFVKNLERTKIACASRCLEKKTLTRPAIASRLAGSLLINGFDQAERTHTAMLARGYDDTDN